MHPVVKLAMDTVEAYVKKLSLPAPPDYASEAMSGQAGVFVSIKKKGALRGCIGTFQPTTESIGEEVVQNAVSAATADPRFAPVNESELDDLEYSVDVLSPPERVSDRGELDPKRYGVIVRQGGRKGLLLPDLDGVDSVDQQISIASMKAGIHGEDDIELYRFEVRRYR